MGVGVGVGVCWSVACRSPSLIWSRTSRCPLPLHCPCVSRLHLVYWVVVSFVTVPFPCFNPRLIQSTWLWCHSCLFILVQFTQHFPHFPHTVKCVKWCVVHRSIDPSRVNVSIFRISRILKNAENACLNSLLIDLLCNTSLLSSYPAFRTHPEMRNITTVLHTPLSSLFPHTPLVSL